MYFVRKIPFDSDPYTLQLDNCVLNLRTNLFETTTSSHMSLRSSTLALPEAWLLDPSLIASESAEDRRRVFKILWSLSSAGANASGRTAYALAAASASITPTTASPTWEIGTRRSSGTCSVSSPSFSRERRS